MGVAVGWPWSYRALIRPAWLLSQRVPQERFCQETCGAGDSSNDSCAVLAVVRYCQAPRPLRAALHHSRLGPPCPQSSMSSQYPRRQTCPSRAEVRKLHHAAFRVPILTVLCLAADQCRLRGWPVVVVLSMSDRFFNLTYSSRAGLGRGFTAGGLSLPAPTGKPQRGHARLSWRPSTQLRCVFATAP